MTICGFVSIAPSASYVQLELQVLIVNERLVVYAAGDIARFTGMISA